MSGKEGANSEKNISKDVEQLIKETEAKMKEDGDTVKPAKSKSTAKVVEEKSATKNHSTASSPRTFSGRDIPFNEKTKSSARIQAPLPNTAVQSSSLPSGNQPVLPPIPDASTSGPATVDTTAIITGSGSAPNKSTVLVPAVPSDSLPEGIEIQKVPDNVDVNADQNTATFYQSKDGNLETVISE